MIWTSLAVTFLAAILSIFIINRTESQNYFFRKPIQIPVLNIFRIFYGIGQPKMPTKSFGRLIIISFIFWCLVMRTAYQGKLFEFVSSEIRKPEMKSLAQLQANNFTLFIQSTELYSILLYIFKVIK